MPGGSMPLSVESEAIQDVFNDISKSIHGPSSQESRFALSRDATLLELSDARAAQHLLSSAFPPLSQLLAWFASASSQTFDGQGWSWHTDSSSNGANFHLYPCDLQIAKSWHNVQAIVLFCLDSSTAYKDGFLNLCVNARKVFDQQPLRMFLHGLFIYRDQLEVWLFDRSGIWVCQSFDIRNNPQRFLALILAYQSLSDADLGINHFLKQDDNGSFIALDNTTTTSSHKLYLEDKTIACSDDIVGEGTTCYRAKSPGTDQWEYAVKFQWRPTYRRPEERMLKLAMQKNAWGVVSLHYNQDIESTANLRQGVSFGPYSELGPLHDDADASIGSKDEGTDISTRIKPTETPFENRVFTCVVVSPIGRPLRSFQSKLELLSALRDAVRAHRSLFQDAGILHQDVSAGNILITTPIRPGDPHGILIDLDVAMNIAEGPRTPGEVTGTRPFMAYGILRRRNHTYRHDLESFLYVLLWVIIVNQKDSPPQESRLREWGRGSWENSAALKLAGMAEDRFGNILAEFGAEFESLKPLAEKLRGLLFPLEDGALWTGTNGSQINTLYDGFVDAFEEAIQREKVSLG